MNPLAGIAAFVAGVFFWTFSEYVLHRWFHTARGKNFASHEHLAHHARPGYFVNWVSWLAWAGVILVGMVVLPVLAWLVVPLPVALVFGFGWTVAYFVYEWIHAGDHLWAPRTAYGRWARRAHLHHHLVAPLRNLGVTTPVWDLVFRTYDRAEHVQVPRRLASRWLIDDAGQVRPEFAETYEIRGRRTEVGPDDVLGALANRPPTP